MKRKLSAMLLAVCLTLSLAACSTYYQVKDPASGSVYYTGDIKKLKGGAVKFKDEKTKTEVTLQTSEVKEISKDTFSEAVGK
jgi:uncharacterized lipoprotein YmbA